VPGARPGPGDLARGGVGSGADGAQVAGLEAGENVERRRGGLVGRQVDDQALVVAVGQLQGLERHPHLADLGMAESLGAGALADHRLVGPPVGELGAGGRQLVDERPALVVARVARRHQVADLLVGDGGPVGVGGPRPLVGERVAHQVGTEGVEHAERLDQPLVGRRPRQQVGEPVHHERGRRLEAVEHLADLRAHVLGGRHGGGAQLAAGVEGREVPEVAQVVLAEAQRGGEGAEDLPRRVAVAALLEAHQVVDADPGQRGQLGATQARRPPAGPDRESDVGRRGGLAPRPQEAAELQVLHGVQSAEAVPGLGGPVRTSLAPASPPAGRRRMVVGMTNADLTAPTSTLPLAPGRWALDINHFRVGFAARHLGVSKVRGHFSDVEAELVVGETAADSAVTAAVAIASIDTGNADRDAHVLSPDLLDVAARPTMSFRSTAITGEGDDWTLDGELTIGGVTQPVTFAVEFGGTSPFQDGVHAGFEARGEIRRHDFGIHFGPLDPALGNVVKLELDLEFLEPA